ncbi:DUF2584 family protein [Aquibacillus sediminis]|uniref:DUF2584 family protein n=1 Tax=Aquibacillus sediminis TaxID=2574734 RepID=UPI0011082029|nr:DUF2584 family protein [Aquibacillus sediminis]
MSMPLSVEWKLITMGREERLLSANNLFQVRFPGYKLFPIDAVIDLHRYQQSNLVGKAKIIELVWKNNETICNYQLISLQNVN